MTRNRENEENRISENMHRNSYKGYRYVCLNTHGELVGIHMYVTVRELVAFLFGLGGEVVSIGFITD